MLFAGTIDLLRAHATRASGGPDAPLIAGRDGPLRRRQIQSLFARYRQRADLPAHLTTHSLRHSIATHMHAAGVSPGFVENHLGHRSIRSTSIYARISDPHRVAVFREPARSLGPTPPRSLHR